MENLEIKIAEKLELTVMHKSRDSGEPNFYLIGIIPANVEWMDGKKEKIELIENVKVDRFPELKKFLGARVARIKIEHELKESWIKELINKASAGLQKIINSKQLYGKEFKHLSIE